MTGEQRGSHFYDDLGVRELYLTHRHSGQLSPNVVMEEPAFLEAVGSIRGLRVVDLGCGDGSTGGVMLELGAASYLGIDGSEGMIAAALERDPVPGATFSRQHFEDLQLPDRSFGLVISRMALHYVGDLGPVFETVRRALHPGGRFVFSVTHPVITSHDSQTTGPRTSWTVDDYFVRGQRPRPWFGSTVTWHHRTIEDYVRLVLGHGFRLAGLSECEPSPSLLADNQDELQRRRRVPLMLLVSASSEV